VSVQTRDRMAMEHPLTPAQEGMLYHYLRDPSSGVDLEQILCVMDEDVDPARLREAWRATFRRHPALRSSFAWEERDRPVQRVHEEVGLEFRVEDLSWLPPEDREEAIRDHLRSDRVEGFDLGRPPLSRFVLFRQGEEAWTLVWSFPHALLDGRSFERVLREVFCRYDALAEAGPEGPGALEAAPPFARFARWLEARDRSGEERFWSEYLEGFSEPVVVEGPPVEEAPPRDERYRRVEDTLSPSTAGALRAIAQEGEATFGTLIHVAWGLALARYTGRRDVVFGAARYTGWGTVKGVEEMAGMFLNAVPVRVRFDESEPASSLLERFRAEQLDARPHIRASLVDVKEWSEVTGRAPLFEAFLIYDRRGLDAALSEGGRNERRTFVHREWNGFPLSLYVYGEEDPPSLHLTYDGERYDEAFARELLAGVVRILCDLAADPERPVSELTPADGPALEEALGRWNDTDVPLEGCPTVHEAILERAARTPEAVAFARGSERWSYGELDARSRAVARRLRALGVERGAVVGILAEASPDAVAAMLAVLRLGAAYLPLDPTYPSARIEYMVDDASPAALVVPSGTEARDHREGDVPVLALDDVPAEADELEATAVEEGNLAYVIYTSGSTGRPKGVMVEHRNAVNFFRGMDEHLGGEEELSFLSLTSLSFDISVLELLWTLSRGHTVVFPAPEPSSARRGETGVDLSLFYFSGKHHAEPEGRYDLLLEGARFADAHGFTAVWTPERHFHAFGGLYPNPSVAAAALSQITENVRIRAGSVVLPLHHPARVAEEWALVDNLSGGRVDLAFASGWHPEDFLLRPGSYGDRKAKMYEALEVVRRLWRGEAVTFPGPEGDPVEVRTLPRPVQAELPVWITTAGSPSSFESAGSAGANVLTHLLGQSLEELDEKIRAYRSKRAEAGHEGPGQVTVMLHAFVAGSDDEARALVREPMKAYLRTAVGLIRNYAKVWTRPGSASLEETKGTEFEDLSEEDMDALLEFAFERYYETSGLMGSRERCARMLGRLDDLGIDEVACLIDFGVEGERTLRHLENLAELRPALAGAEEASASAPVARAIREQGVTHLQCTPSRMRMLLADPRDRAALAGLECVVLGGEPCPWTLVRELREATDARILNMYGPTETTVWSSVYEVKSEEAGESGVVPIGRPLANTRLYVVDDALRPLPLGVPGELVIGGAGVTRGYRGREDLTEERYPETVVLGRRERLYRTGDRVRFRRDGVLEFLGRLDDQVKVRGHRIELGEIEAHLRALPGVEEAAVRIEDRGDGDTRIQAFVVPGRGEEYPGEGDVRATLRSRLPEVMVPSSVTVVEALPLTPNGKLDRGALPSPDSFDEGGGGQGEEEWSVVEEELAGIWTELLDTEDLSAEDDFFALGGNSLTTIQMTVQIRERFGVEFPLHTLLRRSRFGEMARAIEDALLASVDPDEWEALRRGSDAAGEGTRANGGEGGSA